MYVYVYMYEKKGKFAVHHTFNDIKHRIPLHRLSQRPSSRNIHHHGPAQAMAHKDQVGHHLPSARFFRSLHDLHKVAAQDRQAQVAVIRSGCPAVAAGVGGQDAGGGYDFPDLGGKGSERKARGASAVVSDKERAGAARGGEVCREGLQRRVRR